MKNFIKEKLKNKFLVWILSSIVIILWIWAYFSSELNSIDTNTYLDVVKWDVFLNKEKIETDDSKVLSKWDVIETKNDSIAVIKWWDWSLTRLWDNSKSTVEELFISNDLSEIKIILNLWNWKFHSNIVSYLWEKSHFSMNFEDTTATVRWTTFDIDLSKKYIYVENHEVLLMKWNKKELIKEWTAFDFSIFSFIEIQKFLNEIRDNAWIKINENLDKIHLDELKKEISKTFSKKNIRNIIEKSIWSSADNIALLSEKIKKLPSIDKEKIYNSLLEQYQKLNFVWPEDKELFETKNEIKKVLIASADKKNKENLLRYSLYDLQDALDLKQFDWVKKSLSLLWENMDIVKNLDFNINTNFFDNIWDIPESMKNFFKENWTIFKNVIWDKIKNFNISDLNIDFHLDDIKNKAQELKWEADKLRWKALNKIQDLFNN